METFPSAGEVPWLTTEQMREVDRAMVEDLGIELVQMMENAGRCLARVARSRFLDGDPRGRRVVVLAGRGGNGGGALVCARRLHGWGAEVSVLLSGDADSFAGVPAHQLRIVRRLGIPVAAGAEVPGRVEGSLIVDGLIGYGLGGAPAGVSGDLIRWANRQKAPTLSLDVPSGLDAGSGRAFDPVIEAAATLTLALPKVGLRAPGAARKAGDLYLGDIGVPPELYCGPGLEIDVKPVFFPSDVLSLGETPQGSSA